VKILVAGGAGYLGSLLVPKLLERGYEVTVVDLLWFGNHLPREVPVLVKDVLDVTEDELAGHRQVVFLAGVSNDPMAEYSPSKNFVYNGAAPAYLAYLAKRVGSERFVYGSTCSVYGYTVDAVCDEAAPTVCHYPYGISKLQGEAACLQLGDGSFSVVSLRQGTVCGWSPRMRLDLVVNTMFRTAVAEGRIVVRNPAIWRPVLAIQDAAAAYVRALEASPDVSGVFNVASDNYTVGELGDRVKEAVEERLGHRIDLDIRNEHDLRSYKVSTGKASRVLGFHPRHDVLSIVEELFAHRDDFRDFDDPHYYNIEVFKALEEAGRAGVGRAEGVPR
jgi:nucleoside-diphosphate-sugar epimerase